MTTNQPSLARARANIGLIPLALAAAQTILLYVTTSSLPVVETVYGCNFFCATAANVVITIAALIGATTFALPSVISAFSRTWRGALVLAVLPRGDAAHTLQRPRRKRAGWPVRCAVLAERGPSAAVAGLAGALRGAWDSWLAGTARAHG
jgi:hypothetical protein